MAITWAGTLAKLLLSPWRRVNLEMLIVTQLSEVRFLYVTRQFITLFNKVGRKFAASFMPATCLFFYLKVEETFPPKYYLAFSGLHGIVGLCQKTKLFITTNVKTSILQEIPHFAVLRVVRGGKKI